MPDGASPRCSGGTLDPARPSIDFSATGLVSVFLRHTLGEPPLAGASERNVVQIADPALPPKSRPSDRRQVRRNLEAGYELELVPGPETTPRAARRLPRRLRADDAPHRRRRALLLRRRLLRPHPRSRPHLARPRHRARRRPRRRLARRGQRRLPPLLPLRQRRLAPARLADEERRRPPRSSTPPSSACRSTSAAASPPATPWRSSSAASPTARRPGAPPRSSATERPTSASAPAATPAASSPPTALS